MESLIIFGAKYLIFLLVAFFVVSVAWFFYQKRQWWFVSQIIFSGVFAYIVAVLARMLYTNPRPFVSENITPLIKHAADNGFPSDHALLSAVLALLLWKVSPRLGMVALVLAVLVGASRVLARVHHSLDIATSFIIALICVWLTDLVFVYLRKRRAAQRPERRGSN